MEHSVKEFKCNGYSNAPRLSAEAEAALLAEVNKQRPGFIEKYQGTGHRDLHAGHRFTSDSSVSLRVSSAYTSEEVLQDPQHAATDGLLECAAADHWYTFEKDYGSFDE